MINRLKITTTKTCFIKRMAATGHHLLMNLVTCVFQNFAHKYLTKLAQNFPQEVINCITVLKKLMMIPMSEDLTPNLKILSLLNS